MLHADIKPLISGTGLTEGVTGAAQQLGSQQQSGNRALEIVTIATLILILLLLIFHGPIIALMPLIVIAIVSQVATGLISDVNKALNLNADSSVTTILIVVLFAIGTDYILFLMFRYRERLREGEDAKQAMASAVARVGEVIASAAGVVIVAFLALLLSTLSVLRSLGPTLAIADGERGRDDRGVHGDAVLQSGVHLRGKRAEERAAARRARGRAGGCGSAGRRHERGVRRHPVGGQPRLRGGVPDRRGDHPAHPRPVAAQHGGAVVPDGLGRAGVRRDAGRIGAGLPDPRRPGGLVFLLPVYMYLFVVALGTDYNILMIARLREQARKGWSRARPPRPRSGTPGPRSARPG